MSTFASLCILAYKRPQQLKECIESLKATADYPYELIVNVDGGDQGNLEYLYDLLKIGTISKLILNAGNNRGVGRAFQSCLGVAEGEYIFKLDADLIFKPGWLSKSIQIFKNDPEVGCVGLFDYHRQDPDDERFKSENNLIEQKDGYSIVKDFVSSAYGFRSKDLDLPFQKLVPDDGLHQSFGKMALFDSVDNKSWGFKSMYVTLTPDGTAFKTPTFDKPLLFLKGMI